MELSLTDVIARIRLIPDYPVPGVLFRDITPLIADARSFDLLTSHLGTSHSDYNLVSGIEARGFILGAAIAQKFNKGFIPLRKKGKLPYTTISKSYGLEYGEDVIEAHVDAANADDRVLLVDDVLATGGTIIAALELFEELGSTITEVVVLLEISELGGREKIERKFPGIKLRALHIV